MEGTCFFVPSLFFNSQALPPELSTFFFNTSCSKNNLIIINAKYIHNKPDPTRTVGVPGY